MTKLPETRDSWLKIRKNYIGASEAPIIMNGEHFDMTPYKLWREKLGLETPKKDNFAMQFGRLREEPARQAYERMTGFLVAPEMVFNEEQKFMMATLDGVTYDGKNAVEIKCPGERDHSEAKMGMIPKKYIAQVQHQLACLGLDKMHYFSFKEDEGVLLEVSRNNAYIEKLCKKERVFWDLVLSLKAPELTCKDVVDRSDSNAWKECAKEWISIDQSIRKLEEARASYKSKLIALAEGHNSIGYGVRLSKIVRRGSVDYKSIPKLQGIDLEKYRKSCVEYWSCNCG